MKIKVGAFVFLLGAAVSALGGTDVVLSRIEIDGTVGIADIPTLRLHCEYFRATNSSVSPGSASGGGYGYDTLRTHGAPSVSAPTCASVSSGYIDHALDPVINFAVGHNSYFAAVIPLSAQNDVCKIQCTITATCGDPEAGGGSTFALTAAATSSTAFAPVNSTSGCYIIPSGSLSCKNKTLQITQSNDLDWFYDNMCPKASVSSTPK